VRLGLSPGSVPVAARGDVPYCFPGSDSMQSGEAPIREGEVLAGKYVVESVLGVGGMGVVVRAHHMHLDERVAIKFLHVQALGQPEAVARFAREARAAVKIKGEHVARVTDVGTLENGAPYMVMEYLEGGDLAAAVKNGPLPVADAVEHVLQACEAVAEAHALGIVHRDLKPANLFLTRRPDGTPSIKVLDFGISKSTSAGSQGGMTRTATLMGSPFYMSPEQLASAKNVDPRTDIWALGVTLFELLTGRLPFDGESLPELCLQIVQNPMPSARALRQDIPPGLEAVITRATMKDREQRYRDVAELAAELTPFATERARASAERISRILGKSPEPRVPEVAPDSVAAPVPNANTAAAASWGATAPTVEKVSRPTALLAGAGVTLAALVAGGLFLFTRHETTRLAPDTPVAASSATDPATPTVTPPPEVAPSVAPVPSEEKLGAAEDAGEPAVAAKPRVSRAKSIPAKKPATKAKQPEKSEPAAPPAPTKPPVKDDLGGRT
jgi:eukaryotic-like serine/threonine-protein kinase